jgi:hypothetical protein
MEMVAYSPSDRSQVDRQKDPQRNSVTSGSKLLAGIGGRPLARQPISVLLANAAIAASRRSAKTSAPDAAVVGAEAAP